MAMKMQFEIVERHELTDSHRRIFADLLKKQNKVRGNLQEKADRCKFICLASFNSKVVAIGAIKQKTASDFNNDKAGVPELSDALNGSWGTYILTMSIKVEVSQAQSRKFFFNIMAMII